MNATELIKYIYENNKINYVLEDLGCPYITEREKEFRCGLPNDYNKTRIRIKKNEFLNITIFQSDDKSVRGNIITLTMHVKDINFPQANKYLHKLLKLKYRYTKQKDKKANKTPLDIFQKIKRKQRFNVKDLNLYDQSIMLDYTPNLYIDWLKEGILSFTARKFNIGYDYKSRRIVIPERLWCGEENEYLGIMGRTTVKNFELFDIPKYLALVPYLKSINLYGLQENYDSIQKAGIVSVHEAQKSVLKRHSRLDETGVAVGSHDISDEQVRILLGLNVEIVISFDKGISLKYIRETCEKFYKIRKISYIWDKYGLLEDKEAPADKSDKIYKYLFKHRILYNESEHREYLKSKI